MPNLPETVERCDGALEQIADFIADLDKKLKSAPTDKALQTMKEEQLQKERKLFLHYKDLVRKRKYANPPAENSNREYDQREQHICNLFYKSFASIQPFKGNSPGQFVDFITAMRVFKDSHLRRDGDEKIFLNALTSKLAPNVARFIGNDLRACDDVDAAIGLLKKHYGPKISHFLLMLDVSDIVFDRSRPVTHFTSELATKLAEAKAAFLETFKAANNDAEPNVEDIHEAWATMFAVRALRDQEPDTYNALLTSIDKTFTLNDLALKAETSRRNRVSSDVINVNKTQPGSNNKQKQGYGKHGEGKRSWHNRDQNSAQKKDEKSEKPDQMQRKSHYNVEPDNFADVHALFSAIPVHLTEKVESRPGYFLRATFESGQDSFDCNIEFDTGAYSTILPSHVIPQNVLRNLSAPNHDVAGISGVAETPRGTLYCKVRFDKGPQFELAATVMDGQCRPALLGRDFLRNSNISSYSINNLLGNVKFEFTEASKLKPEVVKLRPLAGDAKNSNAKWSGPSTLRSTNQQVCLVEDANGTVDLIHRSHVAAIEERVPFLDNFDQNLDLTEWPHLIKNFKSKIKQNDHVTRGGKGIESQSRSRKPKPPEKIPSSLPPIAPPKPLFEAQKSGSATDSTSLIPSLLLILASSQPQRSASNPYSSPQAEYSPSISLSLDSTKKQYEG